jgi:xanthine dehydrogenase accessory factor
MNHLQAILNTYQHYKQAEISTFLATVVHTKGSTYRRSGARMLIADRHEPIGMVSGGCLEHDILCHVQQRKSSAPFVITYDSTTAEDIVWGFGLGCDGVVQVLIERLEPNSICHPLTFIQRCCDRQQSGVLATVFQVEGSIQVAIGARLMLQADGAIESTLKESGLYPAIAFDAHIVLQQKQTTHRHYDLPSGQAKVLFEVIHPPTPLIIFGAGRDALPLAQFAKALGWHLTLVDCRSLETTGDRFSMADQLILTRREAMSRQVAIAEQSMAVVMTHNYLDDLEILKMLLSSPAQYIGVLGSRQRTEKLLQALKLEDRPQPCLYSPIGLDIGAETPEEIAIAIIAEIQAVLAHRKAGFLKDRLVPIHPPISQSFNLADAALLPHV